MSGERVLVVDDDPASCEAVAEGLRAEGFDVATAFGGTAALDRVRERAFDIVLSDVRMRDLDGLTLLKTLRRETPDVCVILMTAFANVEAALIAIREGAYDYVSKPLRLDELILTIRRALDQLHLTRENRQFRETLSDRYTLANIIGVSPAMIEVFKLVARVAPTRATVLITGESGTGKEVVARALHFNSPRSSGPFVTIHCAGLAETLLESELFGHVRGAFTGAVSARRGLFEAGHGGTVFLDEIADISPSTQAKLLRVVEQQEIKPVGATESFRIDARLVAATNKELADEVRAGRFREDLLYRLNVVHVALPPLRERREDIPALAAHFLRHYAKESGKTITGIAPETMLQLEAYAWPGNVRELENVIERGVAMSGHAVLLPHDLPSHVAPSATAPFAEDTAPFPSLDELTRRHLVRVLAATGGNKTRTAEILGVDRRTLYRMLERYAMAPADPPPEV